MSAPAVAVVGLGCIGGSLARALAAARVPVRGWSPSREDTAAAGAAGLDASAATLEDAVRGADIVVLAVPVPAMAGVAPSACDAATPDAWIVHCSGVQTSVALRVDERTFARITGAHPIAGSHDSGFGASRLDLFAGCAVSIESRAPVALRERMAWMWSVAGAARLDYRSADEHDTLMTWISQLPQLASTALAATLSSEHIDPLAIGPGARDSTRLASSAFEQWVGLVRAQPATLEVALARLEGTIARVRAALSAHDEHELRTIWESAREWRRGAERSA